MERDDIFKAVQKALRLPPMLLIGSGYSASHGLPGMGALANYLVQELNDKYHADTEWCKFYANLEAGQDLETALTDLSIGEELLKDIRIKTWELVSCGDRALFNKIIFQQENLPLSGLIKYFYQSTPQKLDIVTTNYDRVIEYACDAAHIPVNTGFSGCYIKRHEATFSAKAAVNLIKVHGSLDVFRDSHGATVSLPPSETLPTGFVPEIVTPGRSKYEAVLTGTARHMLSKADEVIQNAKCFLCIGYGFNDKQIQEYMIERMRSGTPIVLITKDISEKTAHLLVNNARNAISICEGDIPGTTRFCLDKVYHILNGTFWTVDGLMEIIS